MAARVPVAAPGMLSPSADPRRCRAARLSGVWPPYFPTIGYRLGIGVLESLDSSSKTDRHRALGRLFHGDVSQHVKNLLVFTSGRC